MAANLKEFVIHQKDWVKEGYDNMQPIAKAWHVWTMAALLVAQVTLSVNYHVLVCNIPIANTVLLLIIILHHGYILGDHARPLFHRICGCVAYLAVLFVNMTHAMELLSDSTGGHSHGAEEMHSDDHDHEENFSFIPKPYLYVSIFDLLFKTLLLVLGLIPSLGLPIVGRFILHTLSPLVVIAFWVAAQVVPPWVGRSWLWIHADPLAAVVMTISFILLIIPSFKEIMPYIFADTPEDFQVERFRSEISDKYDDVTCNHIHAYRLWPGKWFEALIHLNFKVDMSSLNWSEKAAHRFDQVSSSVINALTKAGAQKVIVEPRFVDVKGGSVPWLGCVNEQCHQQDRGCCTNNNKSGEA